MNFTISIRNYKALVKFETAEILKPYDDIMASISIFRFVAKNNLDVCPFEDYCLLLPDDLDHAIRVMELLQNPM